MSDTKDVIIGMRYKRIPIHKVDKLMKNTFRGGVYMPRKDFIKVLLLTAICVAAFVGYFYIAIQYPLVGIYGTIFFAMYPKVNSLISCRICSRIRLSFLRKNNRSPCQRAPCRRRSSARLELATHRF